MKSSLSRRKIQVVPVVLLVLLAISIGFGGYFYKQYKDLQKTSTKTAEEKNKELVTKVGNVYQLPEGEEAVVLNVNKDPKDFTTDQEKAFAETFKALKKGDIILLYEKAGIAIQYREAENKVIGTASLAVKTGSNVAIIGAAEQQTQVATLLGEKFASEAKVGTRATPNGQYTATTVVDLTGQKADLAKKIADSIGGTVAAALPATEKAPEGAELVVILANVAPAATEPVAQ